jgi:hypothetical protein
LQRWPLHPKKQVCVLLHERAEAACPVAALPIFVFQTCENW